MILQHLTVQPVPPSKIKDLPLKIPRELEELIMRCLEKAPQKRPQNMTEILQELKAIVELRHCSISSFTPTIYVSSSTKMNGKNRLVLKLVMLGLLAVLAVPQFFLHEPRMLSREKSMSHVSSPTLKPPMVRLVFRSEPQGAEVFEAGNPQPLGITPLTLSFERSKSTKLFELRLDKHRAVNKSVGLLQGSLINIRLPPIEQTRLAPAGERDGNAAGQDKEPQKLTAKGKRLRAKEATRRKSSANGSSNGIILEKTLNPFE
jgi:serine/threonine protein kinase